MRAERSETADGQRIAVGIAVVGEYAAGRSDRQWLILGGVVAVRGRLGWGIGGVAGGCEDAACGRKAAVGEEQGLDLADRIGAVGAGAVVHQPAAAGLGADGVLDEVAAIERDIVARATDQRVVAAAGVESIVGSRAGEAVAADAAENLGDVGDDGGGKIDGGAAGQYPGDDVVAGAAFDTLDGVAAGEDVEAEDVVTVAAEDAVETGAAADRFVVAVVTAEQEGVVAVAAEHDVLAGAALDDIVAGGAGDAVEATAADDARDADELGGGQVDGRAAGGQSGDDIDAEAAVDALHGVGAAVAPEAEGVVGGRTDDLVEAGAAADIVMGGVGAADLEDIVAVEAEHRVGTAAADDQVVEVRAGDRVVAGQALDLVGLGLGADVEGVVACSAGEQHVGHEILLNGSTICLRPRDCQEVVGRDHIGVRVQATLRRPGFHALKRE